MRYFMDFEFLEDGRTIEMISVGIVAEDGRELYAVNGEMPWERIVKHDWLMENVVPSLPLNPAWEVPMIQWDHPDVKSRAVIAQEVREFLLHDGAPELWAWCGAFDHVCLAQLYGRMIDLPELFPHHTGELRQRWDDLGCPELPEQEAGLHNALADARHNKVAWDAMMRVSVDTLQELHGG